MHNYAREAYISDRENISITYLTQDYQNPTHTHEFVELIFISAGSCCQIIDGVSYEGAAGDLFFVNFDQTHAFYSQSPDFAYYNLLYLPRFFGEELINSENIHEIFRISLFREFEADTNGQPQKVSFRGEDYPAVKKLVEDMYREFREKQVGYRSVLNGYSRVLFSKVLRRRQAGSLPADQQSMQRIAAECLTYIDAHCFERITPSQIAAHTFYNPAYLSRVFKSCCGRSLSEYIREVRMREAGRLLTEGDLPLEQILTQIGYSDKKLFYKHFRTHYQTTPAEYRKNRDKQKE